jgi:hypothetical protein
MKIMHEKTILRSIMVTFLDAQECSTNHTGKKNLYKRDQIGRSKPTIQSMHDTRKEKCFENVAY